MLPEQTNVTCSGSVRHRAPREGRRPSTRAVSASRRRGPIEVGLRRNPIRPRRCRCRARRRPRRHGSGRRPSAPDRAAAPAGPARARARRPSTSATPSRLAPAITSKWPSSPKCSMIRRGGRLGLRGGDGQPHACGPQIGQQRGNAVEERCSSTSRGSCSRRDRRRSPRRRPIAEPHGRAA